MNKIDHALKVINGKGYDRSTVETARQILMNEINKPDSLRKAEAQAAIDEAFEAAQLAAEIADARGY